MENKQLVQIVTDIEQFKLDNTQAVHDKVTQELDNVKKKIPSEQITSELEAMIEKEVATRFDQEIDLNPRALYYALKAEMELNKQATRQDLILFSYDVLEKTTKSKFLKKILRRLKKEQKNESGDE